MNGSFGSWGDGAAPAPQVRPTFQPTYGSTSPRAIVVLAGEHYNVTRYSVVFNTHGATDSATITLPIAGNPDFSEALFTGLGPIAAQTVADSQGLLAANEASSIASAAPVRVDLYAGFAPGSSIAGLTPRFSGIVDRYSARWVKGTITFACRSLAALLVDNKITQAPLNMTSAQFIQQYAGILGMSPNVKLDPGVEPITLQEMLGKQFIGGANFNAAVYNLTPWSMLLQMAEFDGADVWVDQRFRLNYCSPSAIARRTFPLEYGRDFKMDPAPVGDHSVQANKHIRVEVRSYQRRTHTSTIYRVDTNPSGGVILTGMSRGVTSSPTFGTPNVVSTAVALDGTTTQTIASSTGGASSSGVTMQGSETPNMLYKIFRPNLTPARCNQLAQALWRKYSMHEFGLTFSIPMTPERLDAFDITALLDISGVPYDAFNTKMWPRQITEVMEPQSGPYWTVEATNLVPPMAGV